MESCEKRINRSINGDISKVSPINGNAGKFWMTIYFMPPLPSRIEELFDKSDVIVGNFSIEFKDAMRQVKTTRYVDLVRIIQEERELYCA
jgi:hypothetical protein